MTKERVLRPIGYYVHHHGDGHRQRALAVAACAPDRFVLLGTNLAGRTGPVRMIDLPDDRLSVETDFDGADDEDDRPQALHYAPLHHSGVRARMAALAAWIAQEQPGIVVVDVSVEVALLARLCSVPVAYVRLGGQRDDTPHLEAFRAASILIAPFAAALDDPALPDWIRRKTLHAPGIVRRRVDHTPVRGRILVVVGRGGTTISAQQIIAAARSAPDFAWRVIGLPEPEGSAGMVTFVTWSDDPEAEIANAEIVIGGAGDGLVGAVLAARRPFVCIPETRPFEEQRLKAEALGRSGAAIVCRAWPSGEGWPDVLTAAQAIDPHAQAILDDPDGAARLARALTDFADDQK